jgi:type II secretory pathway pseudopilin PulG
MARPDGLPPRPSRGLVLLGVLLLLALAALVALIGAEVWATAVKREREEQLLFVGDQYRRAIESYWRASPGPAKAYPRSLDDLLDDRRFPMPVRHLRRAYRDPNDEQAQWGLVRISNGIAGIYSTSDAAPLKKKGFPTRYREFERASAYRDWRFVAELPNSAPPPRQPPRQAVRSP